MYAHRQERAHDHHVSGEAIAAVAFGDHNPASKSPVTFPVDESDVVAPCFDLECEYSEGLFVGYRALEDQEVNFPFGHGLSYTSFNYSWAKEPKVGANAGEIKLSALITNTGARDGAEVVQLYIAYPEAANEPPKVLKGYAKVRSIPFLFLPARACARTTYTHAYEYTQGWSLGRW